MITDEKRLVRVEPQPTFIESSGRWCWPLPERARFPGCCTEVVSASREWWEYAPSEAKPHPFAEGVRLRDDVWYWAVPVNRIATTEAVASVTRSAAPDVADKGAPSHHDSKGVDQRQPLLHGMESTAASTHGLPGAGCSPAGSGAECDHVGFYYCKKCGKDLTPDIPEQHGATTIHRELHVAESLTNEPVSPQAVAADIAREFREAPQRWTQDYMCLDADGIDWMDPDHEGAVCWCLRGAIDKRVMNGARMVYLAFDRALGHQIASEAEHDTLHFVVWNDEPGRSVAEVIELCERVANSPALDRVGDEHNPAETLVWGNKP